MYDQSKRNLNVLLNYKGEEYIINPKVVFEHNMNYNQLLEWTMNNNSELLLARENVSIADLDKNIAVSGYMPTLDLSASYGYNQRDENWKIGLEDPNSSFTAKLTLRYNLFNGMQTEINRQNSIISYENKKLDLEDSENNVKRDLSNAFNSYKNNLFILEVQERNLTTAEANFKRTQELYKLGQATTIMFREAQLNLIRSKNSFNSAKYTAKTSEAKLLQVSGRLIK